MAYSNPFIQLRRIEFQSDIREVMITCRLSQDNQLFDSRFIISHTELNRIIGDLQERNADCDLYEMLDRYEIGPDLMLYSLDFEAKNIQNTWIPQQIFGNDYRQIRA